MNHRGLWREDNSAAVPSRIAVVVPDETQMLVVFAVYKLAAAALSRGLLCDGRSEPAAIGCHGWSPGRGWVGHEPKAPQGGVGGQRGSPKSRPWVGGQISAEGIENMGINCLTRAKVL